MQKKEPKIVFMGTPEFAAVVLKKLIAEGFDISSVFSQPDKKIGRKQIVSRPPVKDLAVENGIRIFHPDNLRDGKVIGEISEIGADLFVVAAYGKILPKAVLNIPRFGALNVHASLLPKYRGASPIQEALLAGDKETGVSIMRMDEGLDTGDVLAQKKVRITDEDTTLTLQKKLADVGAELLAQTIPKWVSGKIKPAKQNDKLVSYCKAIRKEDGKIEWKEPAEIIRRKWKAYQPWPGIFTAFAGRRLKLAEISAEADADAREKPGKVIKYGQEIAVASGKGLVILKRVQFEGKKEMDAAEFSRGRKDFLGAALS